MHPVNGDPAKASSERIKTLLDNPGDQSVEQIAEELKSTMTNNCGIYRDDEKMRQALTMIDELQERFKSAKVMDKSNSLER